MYAAPLQPRAEPYDAPLHELRQRLLLMAGRVEQMVARSVRALVERAPELAQATVLEDASVDRDERESDALCRSILASHRLPPRPLRFVTEALKMVTDLERIGDLAVNICEHAIVLATLPPLRPYVDLSRMATLAQSMIHDAVDAFVEHAAAKARAVIEADDRVDDLRSHVGNTLMALLRQDSTLVEVAFHLDAVAGAVERIADHATNLAESVILQVGGHDIRHSRRPTSRG